MVIDVWTETSPRWADFLDCLRQIAPEQEPFVVGEYSRRLPCTLLVAIEEDQVLGFLRFGVQPIGSEEGQPDLGLTEAKIHAFAVRPESRRMGIGSALQKAAIEHAASIGCHQLSSHTSYDRVENLRLKLALGFCAAPDYEGDGVRLFFPLSGMRP